MMGNSSNIVDFCSTGSVGEFFFWLVRVEGKKKVESKGVCFAIHGISGRDDQPSNNHTEIEER